MGLLDRVKNRIKAGLGAVKDEAQHPGRPPTFKASTNPFHEEPEERLAHQKAKDAAKDAAKPPPDATKAPAAKPKGEDKPWYLDGTNDGWDDTNPEKDK